MMKGISRVLSVTLILLCALPVWANITATTPTSNGSYTLTWTPPYQGYVILKESTNGGSYIAVSAGYGTASFTKQPGIYAYLLEVHFCSPYGCQTGTATTTVTVAPLPSLPSSTGGLSGPSTRSTNPVSISWGVASHATSYTLQQSKNGGSWTTVYSGSGRSKSMYVMGDGVYRYRVRACNSVGCTGYSQPIQVIVAFTPAVPSNLRGPASSSDGSYDIAWNSVSQVQKYTLQESRNGGAWSTIYNGSSLSVPRSVSASTASSYRYRVRSCKTISTYTNCSGWSSLITVSVEPPPPVDYSAFEYDLDQSLFPTLPNGDFVATTQGNLSVQGGTASYNVAIDLPPAVRDLVPGLAIGYSSGGGDGLMGVGWNLGGFSAIQRCRASFVTEGVQAQKSNPSYSQGDRLCLDGQKLVIASLPSPANDSTYWAVGAEYRTETENFYRIQAHGSHSGAHQYFTVNTKDGRTLTYGREEDSQNSRIYAPGQPSGPVNTWALDKVEDRYGNEYVVHYLRDTTKGEYYPSHIVWEPDSAVVFSYINRTGKMPWGYDAGNKYERTKLLDKVTTYIDVASSGATLPTGTKVKEYDIDYQLSGTTGRHLVKEIRECGFDTNGIRRCAKPLQFEWQAGEFGFEETPQNLIYVGVGYEDINSDGYVDVIGEKKIVAWGSAGGFIAANDSEDEFLRIIQTRFGKYTVRGELRGDYVDIKIVRMSPSGSETYSTVKTLLKEDLPLVHTVDLNNDGLTDIYMGGHFWMQQHDASFLESPATVVLPYNPSPRTSGIQPHFVDLNSDGLVDHTGVDFLGYLSPGSFNNVLYSRANTGNSFNETRRSHGRVSSVSPEINTPGLGYAFAPLHIRYKPNLGFWHSWTDINNDGHMDILYPDKHTGAPQWRIRLSRGVDESHSQRPLIATGAAVVPMKNDALGQHSFVMDYNKDGVNDFVVFYSGGPTERVMRAFYGSYIEGVLSFINSGIDPFMGKLDYLVEKEVALADEIINPFRGDINNDGIHDMVVGSQVHFAKQQQPDLLSKVTDGFGASWEVTYSPLTSDVNNGKPLYTPDAVAPVFPLASADRSMQVVKKLSVSNGIGGKTHSYFNYTGAKQDLQGRGFVGFSKIETTNTATGTITTIKYLQQHPFTGNVSESLVAEADSGKLISRTQNNYITHAANSRFSYMDYSIQQDYQLLTQSLSAPVAVSKIENSVDACGNLIDRTTTVGSSLSGVNVTGDISTTTLVNTILNDGDDDCSDDFITETTVTSTEAGGANPRTVTSTFVPNGQFDIYQQTAFDGTDVAVTTTTNRDAQGVIIGTSATAQDIGNVTTAARTTSYGDFNKIIFPTSVTNAKGHTAMVFYDYRFGKVNEEIDPNGLVSSRTYDSLGRNVKETAADGTVTDLLSYYCSTAPVICPSNAVYLVATRISNPSDPDKLGAPLSITYYDSLQRVVRNEVYSLDQTVVKSDTQYTADGSVYRVSEPFTGFASYWTTYSNYDALGRAKTVVGPDGGRLDLAYTRVGNLLKTTETVTVISPSGSDTQTTHRYTNALGQVVKVEDALNTPVSYTYDAQGNLRTTVVDNNAFTTISLVHDIAGNKTRIADPDAGVIAFAYNGFGELRKQTWQPDLGAYDKSITYSYDNLGRKISRTDQPVSGSPVVYTWSWDASGQLGLLTSQSGNGYTETYGYDYLSRLETQTTNITGLSGAKVFTYEYDQFSRPANMTYPNGLTISRDYHASGIHVRTRNTTGGADDTLWTLGNIKNSRGQLTHELYGNGVVTARAYVGSNGRLASITSGRLTASNTLNDLDGDIQSLSYEFDTFGNLHSRTTQRTDSNGLALEDTSESFVYDSLNRVTESSTEGSFNRTRSYGYDELGNLTNRSDIGALTYNRSNGAGVHAVTTSGASGTSGYKTYSYDKYGNMTRRGGETISYDVFNKPLIISGSTGTTSFSYGPSHQRFKQIGGNKATYVINGGAYEEVVENGVTTQKSYVDGFLVQTKTGTTTESTYLHKDHLGSVEAVTDANGNLINRMSFDVWGQRQQANWQTGIPAAGELASFDTTKGYTGHEQLDQHNLVHMGGRVYDPTIGRFLSADLFVQSPYNTQSFNRYSYVFNNPLSYNDPSGYRRDHPHSLEINHQMRERMQEEVIVTAQRPSNQDVMRQINHSLFVTSWFAQQRNAQDFASFMAARGTTSFTYMESNGDTIVVNFDTEAIRANTAAKGTTAGGSLNGDSSETKNGEGLSLGAHKGQNVSDITGKVTFFSVGEGAASYTKLLLQLRAYSPDKKSWTDFEVTSEGAVSGFEVGLTPASGTSWNVIFEGPALESINPTYLQRTFEGALVTYSSTTVAVGIGLAYGSLNVGNYSHALTVDAVQGFDIGWTGFRGTARVGDEFKYGFSP